MKIFLVNLKSVLSKSCELILIFNVRTDYFIRNMQQQQNFQKKSNNYRTSNLNLFFDL